MKNIILKTVNLPERFETLKFVKEESVKRQKDLTKGAGKRSLKLAKKLASCSRKNRCRSAACPVCFREYRIHMLAEVTALFEQHQEWAFVTLIYYSDAMTNRELSTWDPIKLKRRLGRQLERAGMVGPGIGSFEVDFHTDQKSWLPHVHFLIPWNEEGFTKLSKTMTRRVNMGTRPGIIDRPMHKTPVGNPAEAISYLFKFYWGRIDRYADTEGKSRTAPKRRLRERHHRLSVKAMDRIGFNGLRFLYGLRANGQLWEPKLSTSTRKK